MTRLFILLLLFSSIKVLGQDSGLTKVEFSSLSRGSFFSISITPDSIVQTSRSFDDSSQFQRATTQKEWVKMNKDVKRLDLESISTLKSPTMKRAYDGAEHSKIAIYAGEKVYEHLFDDEDPNEELQALLKCILSLKKEE